MEYICEKCKKSFIPKDLIPSHLLRHPPRFCSRKCGLSNRSNGGIVVCTNCGVSLYRRKSFLSETKHPFCSHKCMGQWMKLHYRSSKQDLKEYRYQRRLALERDNYRCVDCGALDNKHWIGMYPELRHRRIVTHHIEERGPDQPPNHNYTNLISLCDSCHRARHHG